MVVSAISPYEDARRRARERVTRYALFVEIHVATSLAECERRDPKGLYAEALAGRIANFTGISDPYEEPFDPELRLETAGATPHESAVAVLAMLASLGLIATETVAASGRDDARRIGPPAHRVDG